MAWQDVPAKLAQYEAETYAPVRARETLLAFYEAASLEDVPSQRQADFEADLDYRLNACINLRKSKADRHARKYP